MKNGLAVVGCGDWGKNLVRNFYDLGALTHVCDNDINRLTYARTTYPNLIFTPTFESLLSNESVTALVIATPAEDHSWMVKAALKAGKDVFVEKPFSLQYRHAEGLVSLAERLNKILMVGHLLEYHPAIVKVKEIIKTGAIGEVQYIYSNRLNLGRIRQAENILWSFATHDIAVILRLMGNLPVEVTSTGGTFLQPDIADVTVTSMRFESGAKAHIFVSWLHPYKEHRLVVIGSNRMISYDDVAEQRKLILYDRSINWVEGKPVPRQGPTTPIQFSMDEPLKNECKHFLDCLKTRRAPLTDGRSALNVLRILDASQMSLEAHGAPVPV